MARGQDVYKSVWTSLTDWCSKTRKCIPVRDDGEHDEYAIDHRYSNIRKGDANTKRDIKNKLIFLNVWHHLKVS